MSNLSTGTVSLLFTDIEGSTSLQKRVGAGYAEIIRDHHRLLRDAFEAQGGHVVDSQADSFFCAFRRIQGCGRGGGSGPACARRARVAAQDVEVRVRMGVHAGQPQLAGDRYLGIPVVRAARICDTGHGGQILLSSAARGLIADNVPDEAFSSSRSEPTSSRTSTIRSR